MNLTGDCSKEQSFVLYNMLPLERKQSVKHTTNKEIAKKRLYTGAFLQYVLSKETGIPVSELRYVYNEWGKPELEQVKKELDKEPVHFNLSHSGDYVVLAVSDHMVGVDVEHKCRNSLSLAKRCFCEEEYRDIMQENTEAARNLRFLEYWTMKEAYIKCVGEGLRIPLNSFLIKRGMNGISFVENEDMWLGTFFLNAGYCVSLCSRYERIVCQGSNKKEIIPISLEQMVYE